MERMIPSFQNSLQKLFFTLLMIAFSGSTMLAQNATNGGTVGSNQTVCQGVPPAMFTSSAPASGGDMTKAIEYLWMSTTNFNTNFSTWNAAAGNNMMETYQAGGLNSTTYFVRCARRNGFIAYPAESNIITVTVLNSPTAQINGLPATGYRGLTVNLNATTAFNGTYRWDFNNDGFIDFVGQNPTFTFNNIGTFTVALTVSNGQCSVTTTQMITITNPQNFNIADPCNCNNPFNIITATTYYNHDFIQIIGNAGEVFSITAIAPIGSGILNQALTPIPVGTVIPETSPGTYFLNLFFDGTQGGWQVTVRNQNGAGPIVLTTGPGAINPCPICPGSPLPVELASFEGKDMGKTVLLKWTTLSETDNSHFEIEKSTDGARFEFIGKVAGSGDVTEAQNYNFEDDSPVNGENYYRLKQIDFDGDFEYSNIISVNMKVRGTDVVISPNPVFETTTVRFAEVADNALIEVVSSTGQVVREVNVMSTEQNIFMGDLPNGIYFFRLKTETSVQNLLHKVVKQ